MKRSGVGWRTMPPRLLDPAMVPEYRRRIRDREIGMRGLAEELGVSLMTIQRMYNRETYAEIP